MADSEHTVNINITGNANVAVNSLNKVKGALASLGNGIKAISGAFGKLNWAVNGIMTLVKGVQWLKDKLTEAAREAAKFKWDLQMRAAANETARLVGWHEKLAKLMKDELDTLNKQRAVQSIETQGKKDLEDGRREAERARQIFEAKTPEEEQALRDRFAAEDEQRAREEKKAQRKQQIENLDKEESVYSSRARSRRDNNTDIDRQLDAERWNLVRANGKEDLVEPIKKRIDALEQRKKANEAEIAQFEKEAKFRRDQIAALENQRDYDGPTAGEWQRTTDAKKRAEEQAKKTAEETEKRDKESSKAAADFVNGYYQQEAQEKSERAASLSGFADRLAATEGVSQNRLTAMGLGSGVRGESGVANDVKRVVKLLEDEVAATKNINVSARFGG